MESMNEPTDKNLKAKYFYCKAKLLSKTNDLKKAEEFISKALKFDSKEEIYWETMSDILYKK